LKQLLITADDFGLTDGVSRGILQCLRRGIVTTTSGLVCDPFARRRLKRWSRMLGGRAGVHLQLTDGRPLSDPAQASSLVTRTGVFPRFPNAIGDINPVEVRREWHAQVAAFQACGVTPTHIDTHHYVHEHPVAFELYCEIAREHNLPARTMSDEMTRKLRERGVRCADLSLVWNGGSEESLMELVCGSFGSGAVVDAMEIVCHPGHVDAALEKSSVYVVPRAQELEVLCRPGLRDSLAKHGIELVSTLS
jgi:predicted glycoside hydrolase/deacetylase ChbG (UPF0249 family)